MSAPFDGNFIGFVNLDDGDGLSQSIQSAIVGHLVPGVYTLTVAVGARPSATWNDVRYEVSPVANPLLGAPDNGGPTLGSRDGTVLGTPATVVLVCTTAIRISVFNALQQNGAPDDGTNGGTVARIAERMASGSFDHA